jgi:WD40 repeat protein
MEILVFNNTKTGSSPIILSNIHTDKITGLAWMNDNLVSVSLDNTMKITDPGTKNVLQTITFPNRPNCLVSVSGSNRFYVGFEDGSVRSVLVKSDPVIKLIRQLPTGISSIIITPDEHTLAAGMIDGKIQLMNPDRPEAPVRILNQHKSTVTSLSFAKDGYKMVSSSFDGYVFLWDISQADPEPVAFREHDSWVWCVSFNHAGTMFTSAGKDKNIFTYISTDAGLVHSISPKLKRNFTVAEWLYFVGSDIGYEPTVSITH